MDFKSFQVFMSEFDRRSERVRILIPEPLVEHFQDLIDTLKNFASKKQFSSQIRFSKDFGIITSSGRTFWVGWHNQTYLTQPLSFKIDTLDVLTARDYINYRRLSPEDAKLAVLVNDLLERIHKEKNNLRNFLNESVGLYIQSQKADSTHRYVTLERYIDFKKCSVLKGDYLIGMQVMLSPDFWKTQENLKIFEIASANMRFFFTEHLARGFADLIKNSIENTFLHFEIHQQNLTCHLRKGKLQKILVHDLQDVIFDPVSFLFSYEYKDWPEKLKQISDLYKVRFFNFYGEQRLNISVHSHYFVPATFYRRYFRNFGNYTRIYNQSAGEDYLFSRKLESIVVQQLGYTDEDLDLADTEGHKIKTSPGYSFLSEHLFWVISRRIRVKQQRLFEQAFKYQHSAEALCEKEMQELTGRAQREVCFFSANIPDRTSLPDCSIQKAYCMFQDKIYLLLLESGQFAALVFIPTLRI
jgi:hypothetical protein